MKIEKTKRKYHSQGFTLLLAVLVSGVLLALGLSIFSITLRELFLSTTARDSQFAFYAADTGAECALYWDIQHNSFSTTTASSINCINDANNPTNTGLTVGGGGWGVPSVFALTFFPDPYCAVVTVTKTQGSGNTVITTIDSRGYNFGTKSGSSCSSSDPRRLERAIRVTY